MPLHTLKGLVLVLLLTALPTNAFAQGDDGPVVEVRGPQVAGGLLLGRTEPGARVRFDEEAVAVGNRGRFLIGLPREDASPRTLRVTLPSGEEHRREIQIRERSYGTQRIDSLPDYLVNPGEKFLERIRRESAQAREIREQVSERLFFDGHFTWPVGGRITGVYGTQRILNGEPRQPHFGIDIAAPEGTPVRAPAPGRVALAHEGMFFSGKTLFLDHGHGLHTSFLHLAEIRVADGERVRRGEVIATVGDTGRSTGPHLDWRASWRQNRVDPALLPGIRDRGGGLDLAAGDRIATELAQDEGEAP